MHKCCSTNNNTSHVGSSSCTCGLFHAQSNSAFSVLFSMPKPDHHYHHHHHHDDSNSNYHMYPSSYTTYPPSSVDCTLSLGTPSTRMSDDDDIRKLPRVDQRRAAAGPCVPTLCWDLLQPKHTTASLAHPHYKINRGTGVGGGCSGGSGGDPLVARRCANCDTTSTPLWRNGPRGPKSLCNACGIRFKKEERRATAAATANGGGTVIDTQQHLFSNSWVHHAPPPQKMQCFSPAMGNEFRFIDEDASMDSDNGISFLSWRLNVHG